MSLHHLHTWGFEYSASLRRVAALLETSDSATHWHGVKQYNGRLGFSLLTINIHSFHFTFITERITNVTIRQQIGLEEPIIKEIEQNQLTLYGHVQRMAEGRLSKIALKWMPKQKRARGRPKKNWMEDIRKAMNERNLNEGQWDDRKQWSLGVGQRRTTFSNRHTYIYCISSLHQTGVLNWKSIPMFLTDLSVPVNQGTWKLL